MAAAGDTFILRGKGQRSPHLWVLLWGPSGPADTFLAVSFTTLEPYKDQTCIVEAGEHPFVQHPTCVMYSAAIRITQEKLNAAFASRSAIRQNPVSPELLERVRAGLFVSGYTVNCIVDMARDEFGA
jgi:hypothetical protein